VKTKKKERGDQAEQGLLRGYFARGTCRMPRCESTRKSRQTKEKKKKKNKNGAVSAKLFVCLTISRRTKVCHGGVWRKRQGRNSKKGRNRHEREAPLLA